MHVTDFAIGHDKHPVPHRDVPFPALMELHTIAALCNAAQFDAKTQHLPLEDRKINGDATDQSILRFAESIRPVIEMQEQWKKVYEVPFNSRNKYMLSLYSDEHTGE
jgi:sodium/potassium-transporting ATPase subunit alpha